MSSIQEMAGHIEKFPQKLKYAKEDQHLTNAQVSEMSGISISTVNKLLGGVQSDPKLYNAAAICKALGLSMDDLFGLSHSEDSPDELTRKLHETELDCVRLRGENERLKEVNQIRKEQLNARKPVTYMLLGLCAVLALALVAYLLVDANIEDAGLIQFGQLSAAAWGLVALLVAAVAAGTWAVIHTTKGRDR